MVPGGNQIPQEIIFIAGAIGLFIVFLLLRKFVLGKGTPTQDEQKSISDQPSAEVPSSQDLITQSPDPVADASHVEISEKTTEVIEVPQIEDGKLTEPTTEEAPQKDLSEALSNTKKSFFGRIKGLFSSKETIKADELEEIEEILYTSDLGPKTVQLLLDAVEKQLKEQGASGFEAIRNSLKQQMMEIFEKVPVKKLGAELGGLEKINTSESTPSVWMIVGVNGAGKTTTIGKLAGRLAEDGKKVLLAAGDTFRAAAGEQLKVWTDRAQVEIFSPDEVKDPSAVAFDAIQKGKARGFDVVIVDTAGRLHTQKNLMEELKKMKRVVKKVMEDAPHETLLVLDANSGQNALVQANEFHQALEVTGVVLTKMDGTAKGGVALGVAHELQIPVKLIGVGEGIHDLRNFEAQEYVDSII